MGHRLLVALTGGSDRKFSGPHSPPGGATSPSLLIDRRLAFPILALLAALAASLLFLLPGGPLHAQDANGPITYAENGMDPVATYTATDPEERPVYWSLLATDTSGTPSSIAPATDSADVVHFSISANGVLSFKFSPDFEAPSDSNATDNTYKVVVASDDAPGAGDSTEMAYQKVTVTVTDVDEMGMITLSAQQPQVSQSLTAMLMDDDATDAQKTAAKWKWEHSEAADGPWTPTLTATMAAYSPLGVVDKYLRVTATYTDKHGSGKSVMAVSAHMVRAVPAASNAAPVFPSGAGARSVDENSPPGTRVGAPVVANDAVGDVLTYTLSGSANDALYRINPATGQITVGARTTLDTETAGTHTVTVTATDPAGGAGDQTVTITVANVNEAPMMTAGLTRVTSHPENTAIDTKVGTSANAYTATDEDTADTALTLSVSGADGGDFDISSAGELTFKEIPNFEMPADANKDNVYMVTVVATDSKKATAMRNVVMATSDTYTPEATGELSAKASYTDGHGAGKTAIGYGGAVIENTANVPPEFASATGEREVAEVMDPAEGIGDPVTATDDNEPTNPALTYTLGGADMASFAIVRASGQLQTKAKLDYETKKSYMVTVMATDSDGASASIDVTIKVTNVDEAPMIMAGGLAISGMTSVEYAEDRRDAVATYRASGPDADMAIWSLEGADAGDFSISSAGVLTFVSAPDYETKTTYMVTVKANDGTNEAMKAVTVMVTNVDEDGAVTLSTMSPRVGTELTATLTDADGMVSGTTWQWASSDAMDGTYTDIEDATSDSYTPMEGDEDMYLRATAMYTDGHGSGKSEIAKSANAVSTTPTTGNTEADKYDRNQDGEINREEVLDAIDAYFAEGSQLTKDQVLDIIDLYLGI